MKKNVFYVENPSHGVMDFYLARGEERTFLFRVEYYSDVIFSLFSAGRSEREVQAEKSRNPRYMKLRERLLRTARYIEKYAA